MSGEGAGTYAGSAVLTAWARMPQGLTFQEAAGYPSVVETAPHVLREVGVEAGQTLPVSGASGGAGSAVLQIARDRGSTVIGTAGPAGQDCLRGLGALATAYGEGRVERVRRLGAVDTARRHRHGFRPGRLGRGPSARRTDGGPAEGGLHRRSRRAGPRGAVLRPWPQACRTRSPRPSASSPSAGATSRSTKPFPLAEAAAAHIDRQAGHTRGRRVLVL